MTLVIGSMLRVLRINLLGDVMTSGDTELRLNQNWQQVFLGTVGNSC